MTEDRPPGERFAVIERDLASLGRSIDQERDDRRRSDNAIRADQTAHHDEDDRKFDKVEGLYTKTLYALVFLGLGFFLNAAVIFWTTSHHP